MWILFSIGATLSQLIRNLFSKKLAVNLSPSVVALSRFIYAFPPVILGYIFLSRINGSVEITSSNFYIWACFMAISQVLATYFRVSLFKYKSFAVSVTLVQVDTIFIAIIGVIFLKEFLNGFAWLGISIATLGLISASLSKNGVTLDSLKKSLFTKATLIALLTGIFLALAGICAKKTFIFLHGSNTITRSLFSLSHILIVEIIILLPLNFIRSKENLAQLFLYPLKPFIIGLCSGIGSFCWLTAYSLTHVAYVRTVGQLEFILATFISFYYLKEKLYKAEIIGILLVITGTLTLIIFK